MLNAYVKKGDILELIDNIDETDGLIERDLLQSEILKLNQYKKPKKKRAGKRGIGYRKNIVRDIEKYQNGIDNDEVGYVDIYFQQHLHGKLIINDIKRGYEHKHFFATMFFSDKVKSNNKQIDDIFINRTIVPHNNLSDIIHVSNRTIYRWVEKKLIEKHKILLFGPYCHFEYYDLEEIKEALL